MSQTISASKAIELSNEKNISHRRFLGAKQFMDKNILDEVNNLKSNYRFANIHLSDEELCDKKFRKDIKNHYNNLGYWVNFYTCPTPRLSVSWGTEYSKKKEIAWKILPYFIASPFLLLLAISIIVS